MIKAIDHVGIAVRSLERSLPFWSAALGLEVSGIETVASEQVKVALLEAGPSRLELLEPTDADSPVARSIGKRGEGIHHLTLGVSDIEGLVQRLRAQGVTLIGDAPRPGAEGRRVAFVHPKSTGGVLLELVQQRPQTAESGFAPGAAVLVYVRDPQEKLWGVLRRLDSTGVMLEGIDLASFDDWIAQLEREETSVVGPSLLFLPANRLEKVVLDRNSGELPSLAQRFERRIGRTVQDVIDAG